MADPIVKMRGGHGDSDGAAALRVLTGPGSPPLRSVPTTAGMITPTWLAAWNSCIERPSRAALGIGRQWRGPEAASHVTEPTNVPRLALSVGEACEALGISWDLWHQHVEHEIRLVHLGRRKVIAVPELERWLEERGERVLDHRHDRAGGRG